VQNDVRVAAVAVDTKPGELEKNLETIDRWCATATEAGAQLVLFQELSLTGFIPNHPKGEHDAWLRRALREARSMAQTVPGPGTNQLTEIAKRRNVLVAAGLLEEAGNVLFNTHVLVGPDGFLGAWRKMHVPMYEMPFYNGGGPPEVVDTTLGRIGVNICFDALLPESTRLLAVQNVEFVLFPFAADTPPVSPQGWADWAGPALKARCVENGIFGIACNSVGRVECAGVEQNFPGGGMIVGPRGESIQEWTHAAGEPGMIVATLSADTLRAARAEPEYLFRFRRPELYGSLAQPLGNRFHSDERKMT
jgi:predicted amidohydrolase